jgi:hypothetical protein
MHLHSYIETMGVLLKEEMLQTIDHMVLPNTLVLESLEPFPGYHGENTPMDAKPDSIFLISEKQLPPESVFRASQKLLRRLPVQFDTCPADIFIHHGHLPCIRIKGLSNYSLITDIQSFYLSQDITFSRYRKMNDPGLIRIEKVFCLERMEEHYYKDLEDERTFYFDIPYHFVWNDFKNATLDIKNNLDNNNFDAALGFIFQKEILEMVRIYTHHGSIERLQVIREKYLEKIKRTS